MVEDNDIAAHNEAVSGWLEETLRAVKSRYGSLIHSGSGDGLDSIKGSSHRSYGEIDALGIKFARHLVFLHKGAGKGMGGAKGSTWTDPSGGTKSTNPLSLGKMNTGRRHAEEWLNPVMNEELPRLADIVANFKADQAVNSIQIK